MVIKVRKNSQLLLFAVTACILILIERDCGAGVSVGEIEKVTNPLPA